MSLKVTRIAASPNTACTTGLHGAGRILQSSIDMIALQTLTLNSLQEGCPLWFWHVRITLKYARKYVN